MIYSVFRKLYWNINRCLDRLPPSIEWLIGILVIVPPAMGFGQWAGKYLFIVLDYAELTEPFLTYMSFWGVS